ncbi:MAG: TIM barrel protein [Armatimonadetes bacterium]|nr:TIM barrel protein [Armatimonadota bacterium]
MALRDLRPQKAIRTGEELVRHLNSFSLELKFSAGVWFFAPGGGRFHDRYCPAMTMEEILEAAASLQPYGLQAVEAHYPNEINEDNLEMFKTWMQDTGMRVLTVVPNLFYESRFEFGSLSNFDNEVRGFAVERVKTTLQINRELDTDFAIVWPGGDGFENTFGHNHAEARRRFADGLTEAMDAVPGVRICIEPKPYEPRGHILYGTTAEGLLLCERVEAALTAEANRSILAEGHALMALNPEVGHMLMAYEDLAYSFSLICEYGRLGHTHWNAQPLGNYDQDLNVGVIAPEQAEAALYALKMHSYTGYFGIDINPERMPVKRALLNCMDALKGMNARIDQLDHARIVEAIEKPAAYRGLVEAILIRARYGGTGAKLSEL